MKFSHLSVALLLGYASQGLGQIVVPANPKKFATRPIGGSSSGGITVEPAAPNPNVRYVTHLGLSEIRQWKSADGKPLQGKLIAFEDLVIEVPKGSTEPVAPTPPAHPTVVRDGKARLMVNKKPFEVVLERLSQEDQKLIESIRIAHMNKKM